MTLFLAWFAFPLVLGLLCLGCGLLLERVSGLTLPAALLLPLGLVGVSLVAQFAILSDTTAELAAPAVVVVAILGLGLTSRARRRSRPDGWLVATGVAAYAAYATPAVLTGGATFLGYITLDDTATYLAMLDRALEHGYDVSGLAPSTYEATLDTSLALGYPLGSVLPWGIGHELVRTDPAWLWQPYVTVLATLLALTLWALIAGLVASRPLRAAVAVVGSQAALLYGYALWGGIKEIAIAALVALVAVLVPLTAAAGDRLRTVVPLAAASAAVLGVLSVGGAAWLAPPLVGAIVLVWRAHGPLATAKLAGAFVVAACLFAIPSFVAAAEWLSHTRDFRGDFGYGNLRRRLDPLQVFGIWPNGDFRTAPERLDVTRVLVVVVAAAAVYLLVFAWRRRAWPLPLALAAAAFASVVYVTQGSPWIGGKALASSSPLVLAAALAAASRLFEGGRRIEAGVLGGVVVAGVLWSNALQYHAVSVAPEDRLAELESIGERYAGQGPALATEFEVYGTRHFLRTLDAESPSELRRHFVRLRSGSYLSSAETGVSPDVDELALPDLLFYRTLVVRRSGVASRPPSDYSLVETGRYYQVWQRTPGPTRIVEHLALGSRLQPAAGPPCAEVLRLGRLATRSGGVLATVPRQPAVVIQGDGTVGIPSEFGRYGEYTGGILPDSTTTVESRFVARADGVYGVWVGGSFRGVVRVFVDDRPIGSARNVSQWPLNFVELGTTPLAGGAHTFRLEHSDAVLWRPGSGGLPLWRLGPFAIAQGTQARPFVTVPPGAARTLCGRSLDWIEVVAG